MVPPTTLSKKILRVFRLALKKEILSWSKVFLQNPCSKKIWAQYLSAHSDSMI